MTTYIGNAFSLNMLASSFDAGNIGITKLDAKAVRKRLANCEPVSAVGHADTAVVFSAVLDMPVACNRMTLVVLPGDVLIVGQYKGPRLPEGAKSLPEGAAIEWYKITLTEAL